MPKDQEKTKENPPCGNCHKDHKGETWCDIKPGEQQEEPQSAAKECCCEDGCPPEDVYCGPKPPQEKLADEQRKNNAVFNQKLDNIKKIMYPLPFTPKPHSEEKHCLGCHTLPADNPFHKDHSERWKKELAILLQKISAGHDRWKYAMYLFGPIEDFIRQFLEAEREKTKETKECECPEDTTACEMPYRDPMLPPKNN